MEISVAHLWKDITEYELIGPAALGPLRSRIARQPGAAEFNAMAVAKCLVAAKALTKFQAQHILGGNAGQLRLGPYRLRERYQDPFRAGMFLATHVASGHPVELDFLPLSPGSIPDELRRCADEHRQITHAALNACYEWVPEVVQPCVALEHVEGQTLAETLPLGKYVVPPVACHIVHQVAAGLAALHRAGIAHGNVSPDAVIIRGKRAKLLRRPLYAWHQAQDNSFLNTEPAEFSAPELAHQAPDSESDVYSLGALLLRLLTGKMTAPDATVDVPQPAGLASVVQYMLTTERASRFRNADAVITNLQPYLSGGTALAPQAPAKTLAAYRAYLSENANTDVAHDDALEAFATNKSAPTSAGDVSFEFAHPGVTRRRRSRRFRGVWPLLAGILVVAAALGWRYWRSGRNESLPPVVDSGGQESPAVDSGQDAQRIPSPTDDADTAIPSPVVDDDGQMLWASPTAGPSIALDYVPSGAQLFLVARPAEILASDEGRRAMTALGPRFAEARTTWERNTCVRLEEIERLVLTLVPRDDGNPTGCWTVYPQQSIDVVARWKNATQPQADQPLYELGSQLGYVPADAEQGEFVVGMPGLVREIAAAKSLPPLSRPLNRLLAVSDAARHVNVLCAPGFLWRDGRGLFRHGWETRLIAMESFIGDDAPAALLSAHLYEDADFFGELRLITNAETSPSRLADRLRKRIGDLPDQVENYVTRIEVLDPYWRPVAMRIRPMVDFLQSQTRVRPVRDHAVANFSLPLSAAHNLILASELAVSAAVSEGLSNPPPVVPQARPKTLADVLAVKMSLTIPQQSLEFAMRDLAVLVNDKMNELESKFRIQIVGVDLQAEGITRNQQIRDFDVQNVTVAELLTELVMRANPVTTVSAPNEPDQKLVWVIGSDPNQPNERIILITTRKATLQKGLKLPAVFR